MNSTKKQLYEDEKKRLSEENFSPLRGDKFKTYIQGILTTKARLPKAKVDQYLNHLDIFEQAFTHISVNPNKNYEAMEMLGDSAVNFCVVNYLTERFPELMNGDGSGVGTLSRLKINLVSKVIFSRCAQELKMGDYIASNMLVRRDEMPTLLEDVFEAFQGALIKVTKLCDPQSKKKGYMVNIGPTFRIISTFFDNMEISLKYEDLYDPKSRLKQLLEKLKIRPTKTKHSQVINEDGKIVFTSKIQIYIPGSDIHEWGVGTGFFKAVAEQNACEQALINLAKAGFTNN